MTDHADYRAINPPRDKSPEDYTYAERRARLYDLIDDKGHYRNLERSTRQLGDRFGVSHTQIQNDIDAILDYKRQNLGENIKAELETLKTKAVDEALENGDAAEAYEIISEHLENLQSVGIEEKEPEKHELTGEGGGAINVNLTETVVETDYDE